MRMCLETEFSEIGNGRATSVTRASPTLASRATIARRVGSASAARVSSNIFTSKGEYRAKNEAGQARLIRSVASAAPLLHRGHGGLELGLSDLAVPVLVDGGEALGRPAGGGPFVLADGA